HRVDFNAEFFRGDVFAVTIVARLHELNHAAVQATPSGAHHQTERAGSLALAVACMDHQQPARRLLIIATAPLIFFLFHSHKKPQKAHKAQKAQRTSAIILCFLCLMCCCGYRSINASSVISRAPLARFTASCRSPTIVVSASSHDPRRVQPAALRWPPPPNFSATLATLTSPFDLRLVR